MKKVIVLAICLCFGARGFCQTKEISISLLNNQHVPGLLILEDSLVKVYNAPLIEVFRFNVKLYKASLNPKTNEISVTGRICSGDTISKCNGLPNVSLFKAQRNSLNILNNMLDLGESSYSADSLEKNGFFDVKFKIKKGESLFFYMPHFYLEEFKLNKFISKAVISKKKRKPIN